MGKFKYNEYSVLKSSKLKLRINASDKTKKVMKSFIINVLRTECVAVN